MFKENYNVLGVMSGTSLDGVDLAHIYFSNNGGHWSFKIGEAATVPYDEQWLQRLRVAIDFNEAGLDKLNREYTELLAGIITNFITSNGIEGLDAVCSHGHTILHKPHEGLTLQIGNLQQISSLTQQTVVCDFRVQDVALGGQGAPLVPLGDRMLFHEHGYCLNLGGFSNISFEEDNKRIAFDICPVNTVLNYYAGRLGLEYDNGGAIAASGSLSLKLLEELNSLDFYKSAYPKSLGFEYVKNEILPLIEMYKLDDADVLRTFTEHIAIQIANVINIKNTTGSLLITGGGAYNTFLVERLKDLLYDIEVVIPDDKIIQYKEALIFGFLGVLKLRGEVNVMSSVTGAGSDHSSGIIFNP